MAKSLLFASANNGSQSISTDQWFMPGCGICAASSYGDLTRLTFRESGTLSYMTICLSSNANNQPSTAYSYVGGATGNQSISIAASTAGTWSDTSNTDSVSDTTLVSVMHDRAGGAGSTVYAGVGYIYDTSSVPTMYYTSGMSGILTGSSNVTYSQIGGRNRGYPAGLSSETRQAACNVAGTFSKAGVYVSANSHANTATLSLQINGGGSNIAVSITASTAGTWTDLSNTDTVSSGDQVSWKWTMGASSGSMTIWNTFIRFQPTSGTEFPVFSGVNDNATFTFFTAHFSALEWITTFEADSGSPTCAMNVGQDLDISKLGVRVILNQINSGTWHLRLYDGADTNCSVDVTSASGTGWMEDDGEDTVAAGSDLCIHFTNTSINQYTSYASAISWVGDFGSGGSTGTASITLGATAISATGTTAEDGELTKTLDAVATSATGATAEDGELTETLGNVAVSAAGIGESTATLSAVLGDVAISAAGTCETPGALSETLGAVAISATGSREIWGDATEALGAVAISSAATCETDGTATVALEAVTLSAAGTMAPTGALTQALGDTALSSAGVVPSDGDLSAVLGDVAISAAGVGQSTGTLSQALEATAISATGALAGVSGGLTETLGAVAISATGVVPSSGSLTEILGATAVSTDGDVSSIGAASITLGAVALSATGSGGMTGSTSAALEDTAVSATGVVPSVGALSQALVDVALSSAGGVEKSGTANIALADTALSGSGATSEIGAASQTLADVALSASGTQFTDSNADSVLGDVTIAATGTVLCTGAASVTLNNINISSAGDVLVLGEGSVVLADTATSASGTAWWLTGAIDVVLGDVVLSGQGTIASQGGLTEALADTSLDAAGFVNWEPVLGTATITLEAVSISSMSIPYVVEQGPPELRFKGRVILRHPVQVQVALTGRFSARITKTVASKAELV